MTLELAMKHHAAGNLDEAEQAYRRVLVNSPFNCVALEKLALVCLMTGRAEEGRKYLNNAIKINPKNAESFINLGIAQRMMGNFDDAISSIRQAISLGAEIPESYINLGDALKDGGQTQEALSAYERAIALNRNCVQAHNALGAHWLEVGELEKSLPHLKKVVVIQPDFVQGHHNLGILYQNLGRFDDAISACKKAIALQPNPLSYANLGNAYLYSYYLSNQPEKLELAVDAFNQAIKLQPELALAYNNLGQALREQSRFDEAIENYKTGLQYHPFNVDLWLNLGLAYEKLHRTDEAHGCYQRILQERCRNISIDSPVRKIGILLLELLKLPTIYESEEDLQSSRGFFTGCLNQASTLIGDLPEPLKPEDVSALRWILFLITNFYLSYHQMNDKALMTQYAQLATNILKSDLAPYLEPIPPRAKAGKIRVGVASAYLCEHHGAMWTYAWLSNLPAQDYEFFLYSLNGKSDEYTRKFASLGTFRWFDFREGSYLSALQRIKSDGLDIMLFPDVGMNPASRIISLARLAPVQCVGWGHPGTTGSTNVDYFLSSEWMEPEDSANRYCETLVKFKNLGLTLDPPSDTDVHGTREQFGLPTDKVLYGTVQSAFKYLPRYDFVYAEMAKRDPSAFFVFVESSVEKETIVLGKRLRDTFEAHGLSFDERAKIIPRCDRKTYMKLLSVLDVNLNSIGWNGGYTTMDSMSMNLPMVTTDGESMTGRSCQAMLSAVGVDELIGKNVEDYINIAVKLGTDSEYRKAIVAKIKDQKHKLFNDLESARELDALWKSCHGGTKILETKSASG
ncbi:MAG: tetratricopeptide repeat protein [Cyanobacteria bacterium SZAS-4]|nr:tetratricopeptide repeat protein [Cyanobacteria bacterium SZAS-4]